MSLKVQSSRAPLKEKFVQIYEGLFNGEDLARGNEDFWDELFLLKVNVDYIRKEFAAIKLEKLVQLKPVINTLFYQCVRTLKSDHRIRIVHALQTLCALLQGVFSKPSLEYGFDTIDLLIGFENADRVMQCLIETSCTFLSIETPHSLKLLVLKLLIVTVTATENVSNNTFLEYLMTNSVFEAAILILADPSSRKTCGYDAVLLLTVLVNYRKYESTNPYIMKLSIADNELALNGFGQVVASTLSESNRKFSYNGPVPETQNSGSIFSGLTSFMGIFSAVEDNVEQIQASDIIAAHKNDAVLLAMYEAVHLNRNFLAILTNSQLDSGDSSSPSVTPSIESKDISQEILDEPPTNLFVTFIEFTSIVMQNTKDPSCLNTTKLCFIVLTCISEDQYANSIMHDVNLLYKVRIHHMPMRHRKVNAAGAPSRPLAGAVLDLMVEFILSNLKKNFHVDLYMRCLGITHRLLCYQKRCRVRLSYCWKDLWTALISLLKFILNNEFELVRKHNIFTLCSQVVNIINLFITYGDTFLAAPTSYDELYYEIIRMNHVFDNLYSMAIRYTAGEVQNIWKDSASRLANFLVNIRAIVNHFTPKITCWSQTNGFSSLTEEQVLEVVRSNYDSLTLKLHDNLDQFERYSEKPRESGFFAQMVRGIVAHVKSNVDFSDGAHQSILREFATIT